MARSAASIAKNSARSQAWAIENKAHINAQRRASRAKARPEKSQAEQAADSQFQNWLATENLIRTVVGAAITAGTIQRGSDWFDMTLDEYLATPLPPYWPGRQIRLQPKR